MAALIADLITPVLIGMTLYSSWRKQKLYRDSVIVVVSFLLITFHYHLDALWQIWGSMGHDYSSHTAVLVAPLMLIYRNKRHWLTLASVCCLFYFWLMIMLGYHTLVDIISTLIFVTPQIWLVLWFCQKKDKASGTNRQRDDGNSPL